MSGEEEEEEFSGVKRSSAAEDDQVKLISEIGMKTQSDSLVDEDKRKKIEEKKDEKGSSLISLGLDGGGFPHFKLPGTYSGSIGFNSNGSVYLDGNFILLSTILGAFGCPSNRNPTRHYSNFQLGQLYPSH